MIKFIVETITGLPDGSIMGKEHKIFTNLENLETYLSEDRSFSMRSLIGYEIIKEGDDKIVDSVGDELPF